MCVCVRPSRYPGVSCKQAALGDPSNVGRNRALFSVNFYNKLKFIYIIWFFLYSKNAGHIAAPLAQYPYARFRHHRTKPQSSHVSVTYASATSFGYSIDYLYRLLIISNTDYTDYSYRLLIISTITMTIVTVVYNH